MKSYEIYNRFEGIKCCTRENEKIVDSYYVSNMEGQVINQEKFQKTIDSGIPIKCKGFSRVMYASLYEAFDCTISTNHDYIFKCFKKNSDSIVKVLVLEEPFQIPFLVFINSDGSREAKELLVVGIAEKLKLLFKKGVEIEFVSVSNLCYSRVMYILHKVDKKEKTEYGEKEKEKKLKLRH